MKIPSNEMIGAHLGELIERKYKSARQFGKAYLVERYGSDDPDPSDIQRMQNRLSQIKKGSKGIQIEDLLIFSKLLGVPVEDILSAGNMGSPVSERVTNYSIAFSKNKKEWEEYIHREDKLILNPDEYGKTVLDYAFEAGNYAFVKYLMENGYIWFVGDNKDEYYIGFGAGTKIERRQFYNEDQLNFKMKEQDDLRFQMITLALKNGDEKVLEKLHARELPLLYTVNCVQHFAIKDKTLPKNRNIDHMLKAILESNKKVQSYFFDDFEVDSTYSSRQNSFIFPYAGELLDLMVKKQMKGIDAFLIKTLKHNREVYKRLTDSIEEAIEVGMKRLQHIFPEEELRMIASRKDAIRDYAVYPKVGFIGYLAPPYGQDKKLSGFVTNIVKVSVKSKDREIQELIDELNESYDAFITKYENKEV